MITDMSTFVAEIIKKDKTPLGRFLLVAVPNVGDTIRVVRTAGFTVVGRVYEVRHVLSDDEDPYCKDHRVIVYVNDEPIDP